MNRREVDPDELKELYVARMTHEEMAERLGVSAHVIGDRLRELGLRTDIARHLDIDEISRLFDSGMSVNQISKRVGYSRKTITKYLADAGREMRSHVEAGRLWTAKLTQEERNRLIANAQASQRGQKQPFDLLCKKAKCREANMFMVSRSEVIVREWLEARGLRCTPQKAVGPYNIDVAVEGERIAVEIFGGNWHATGKHAAIFRKRTDYLKVKDGSRCSSGLAGPSRSKRGSPITWPTSPGRSGAVTMWGSRSA